MIVTTTIHSPTEAIERFDSLENWHLIVVGDKKTPPNYTLKRGTYLSPEDQEARDPELSALLGWNCIQRRNFGFLKAHDLGAEIIAVVDDDNIPLPGWGSDLMIGRETEVHFYETNQIAFDPVGATNEAHLWHRGFPLQLLAIRDYQRKSARKVCATIQADFWNGDPDVDALCRTQFAPDCEFQSEYFPISSNKPSPFNSQNTFLHKSVLKDYFMFPETGRMQDIWASYYVQAKGHKVVYGKPSVWQKRNPHDSIEDMKLEYLGYEQNLNLIRDLSEDPNNITKYLSQTSLRAFQLYQRSFS